MSLPVGCERVHEDPRAHDLAEAARDAALVTDSENFLYGDASDRQREVALASLSVFADDLLNAEKYPEVQIVHDADTGTVTHTRLEPNPYRKPYSLSRRDAIVTGSQGARLVQTYTFDFGTAGADAKPFIFIWGFNSDKQEYFFRTPWRSNTKGVQDLQETIERTFEAAPEQQKRTLPRWLGRLVTATSHRRGAMPKEL